MEHTIQRKLENIKKKSDNRLIQHVIDDALRHGDGAEVYLNDVHKHGCQSGVSGLIYHSETKAFFQEFAVEIGEAFFECAENHGVQPQVDTNMHSSDWFAWFGYEWAVGEVLRKMEEYDPSEYDDVDDNN